MIFNQNNKLKIVLQWLLCSVIALLGVLPTAHAGLLWSLNGEHNTVYLLGSMHMLPKKAYPMPPGMESAWRDSQTVVFETDIDAVIDPALQMRLLQMGTLPEGETLSGKLGKASWQRVSTHAQDAGLPGVVIDRFQPWFAANVIVLQQLQRFGYDRIAGLDLHYWKRSRQAGKRLQWLEPLDDQVDIFAGITEEESRTFLELAMDDIEALQQDPELIYRQWKQGDLSELAGDLALMKQHMPGLHARIHTERNLHWLPQIEGYLQANQNILIVVGAMHLLGADGLIELLRERGYQPFARDLKRGWRAENI